MSDSLSFFEKTTTPWYSPPTKQVGFSKKEIKKEKTSHDKYRRRVFRRVADVRNATLDFNIETPLLRGRNLSNRRAQ